MKERIVHVSDIHVLHVHVYLYKIYMYMQQTFVYTYMYICVGTAINTLKFIWEVILSFT